MSVYMVAVNCIHCGSWKAYEQVAEDVYHIYIYISIYMYVCMYIYICASTHIYRERERESTKRYKAYVILLPWYLLVPPALPL